MCVQVVRLEAYGFGADIWSLGCCVYNLLTGKRPHHGKNAFQVLELGTGLLLMLSALMLLLVVLSAFRRSTQLQHRVHQT